MGVAAERRTRTLGRAFLLSPSSWPMCSRRARPWARREQMQLALRRGGAGAASLRRNRPAAYLGSLAKTLPTLAVLQRLAPLLRAPHAWRTSPCPTRRRFRVGLHRRPSRRRRRPVPARPAPPRRPPSPTGSCTPRLCRFRRRGPAHRRRRAKLGAPRQDGRMPAAARAIPRPDGVCLRLLQRRPPH
jgi:hypothetical protein